MQVTPTTNKSQIKNYDRLTRTMGKLFPAEAGQVVP